MKYTELVSAPRPLTTVWGETRVISNAGTIFHLGGNENEKICKKILTLALALICALAATAFASSFALDFPVAGRTVSIAGNMSQWSVIGEIYVDDGLDTGELRRASVELWYIKDNGSSTSTVKWNTTIVESIYSGRAAQAQKTFTANEKTAYNIVCMSYAAESFRAYVPYKNGSGTVPFTEGPDYVSYLMQ